MHGSVEHAGSGIVKAPGESQKVKPPEGGIGGAISNEAAVSCELLT